MSVTVRPATEADLAAVAATHVRAFADDPLFTHLVPDRRRWDRLAHHLFRVAAAPVLDEGSVWVDDEVRAAAVWAPPGHRIDHWRELRAMPALASLFRLRSWAGLRYQSATRRAHPAEPHWYLAVLGTDPAHQGRGLGAAVLEPILARCDEEGRPAYLESSKEANLAFYARFGFELTGELRPDGDGPAVWTMWRPAR